MPSGVGYADLCTAVLNRNAHPIIGESEIENVRCYILARQIRQLCSEVLFSTDLTDTISSGPVISQR